MGIDSIIIIVILLIDLFISCGYSFDFDKTEYHNRIEYILYLNKFRGTYSIDQESMAPKKEEDVEYKSASFEPNIKRKIIFKYIKTIDY